MRNSLIYHQKTKVVMGDDPPKSERKQDPSPEFEKDDNKLQFKYLGNEALQSVINDDKESIDTGKLLNEAYDNSISSFVPDIMFEQLVNNYSLAKQIYGPKLLKSLTGYDENYLDKNINIPEFQRDIKNNIKRVNR